MNDVEILFATSKEALAERLREAIERAGYSVAPGGDVAPGAVPETGQASAALVVWDRSSIAHPGLKQAAAAARNRGRAVDISADGITPVDLTDERHLVQLSAWRGEPTHPGWKKILAELERLCGGARVAAPIRPAAAEPRRASDAGAAPARGVRGKAKLAAAAVGVVLVLVLIGFVVLSGRRASVGGPAPAGNAEIAAAQPLAAPTSGTADAASPAGPQPAAPAPPAESQGAVPAGAPLPNAAPAANASEAAAPPARQPAAIRSRNASGRARAPRETPSGALRYTRYSKTMRLFCERSGRHTPQCRTFHAAQANADAAPH